MPPLHKRLAAIIGLSLLLLFASGFIPEQPTDHSLTLTTPPPELESSQASGVSNAQAGALLPDAAANSVETWDPAVPEKYVVNEMLL